MFYIVVMERIGIRELNQHTSAVLAKVRQGQVVEVTERGRPIARLVPVDSGLALLDRLVAQGQASAPTASGPIPVPPILGDPALNVADELAAAREDERW